MGWWWVGELVGHTGKPAAHGHFVFYLPRNRNRYPVPVTILLESYNSVLGFAGIKLSHCIGVIKPLLIQETS